jgi:hypothetical protein
MRIRHSLVTIGFVFAVLGAAISPSFAEGANNDPGGVSGTGVYAKWAREEAARLEAEKLRKRAMRDEDVKKSLWGGNFPAGKGVAMDRLGGGPINQQNNPKTVTGKPTLGGSPPKLSASAVAKPAGGGSVLQPTPRSMPIVYGGCAGCDRRDPLKVR